MSTIDLVTSITAVITFFGAFAAVLSLSKTRFRTVLVTALFICFVVLTWVFVRQAFLKTQPGSASMQQIIPGVAFETSLSEERVKKEAKEKSDREAMHQILIRTWREPSLHTPLLSHPYRELLKFNADGTVEEFSMDVSNSVSGGYKRDFVVVDARHFRILDIYLNGGDTVWEFHPEGSPSYIQEVSGNSFEDGKILQMQ